MRLRCTGGDFVCSKLYARIKVFGAPFYKKAQKVRSTVLFYNLIMISEHSKAPSGRELSAVADCGRMRDFNFV